ncbi:uncharacterized protein DS421_7g212070 [Arachis hypogaea]|nr:uncharacterized protein DS421_7g212070 [Arachis hypogaea]
MDYYETDREGSASIAAFHRTQNIYRIHGIKIKENKHHMEVANMWCVFIFIFIKITIKVGQDTYHARQGHKRHDFAADAATATSFFCANICICQIEQSIKPLIKGIKIKNWKRE